MSKTKIYLIIIAIFLLAFLAGNLVYPQALKLPRFPEVPFRLGLDLRGGTHLIYESDLANVAEEDYEASMQGLRDVIERRVNLFGVSDPLVQTQKAGSQYRLIVELAGIQDPALAIEMIGQTPYLEFQELKENYEEIVKRNEEILESGEGEMEETFQPTPLTGKYLKKAELGFDPTTSKPLVQLEFNEEGGKIFEELTSRNIGKYLAIYIDGIPISIPTVQEVISGGKAQITGSFTVEEAKALVLNLNAGALPVPIHLISQQTVGPTLGAVSLEESLKAGLMGFLAVIVFMLLFYRLPGLVSALALAIYVVLVLSVFKLIPVTLTLAGIGGFILSIGMAIDANVLIFSRMREELKKEKGLAPAIEDGFSRAWPSIRDGNLTTLIVAAILFVFGTSFIKGFALTLSLGVLISMFSAIVITKNFLRVFVLLGLEKLKPLWQ